MTQELAVAFANTLRHDGHGGVRDELVDVAALDAWVRGQADALGDWAGAGLAADEPMRARVVALRRSVRALFARAVRPGPPSRADADRLPTDEAALDDVNRAAARQPVAPALDWPADADPTLRPVGAGTDPAVLLTAALARAAIGFLAGPDRQRLRACTAPRCVRYFVKEHGRQEWCKPSCANRARAARHYRRHHPAAEIPAP